jgi:P-type Mg2+ transporter
MMAIVLFVFTVNMLLHRPLIDSMLFAVALAVGLTPELLPAIVSVTLSAGAQRMARRGVLVRRLTTIENLGAIDVLCTDKTGTLTRGVVELVGTIDPFDHNSAEVMRLAAINARLETGIENPLDAAIAEHADRLKLTLPDLRKIDEIPYDFVRKRLTIVVAEPSEATDHLIVTKGHSTTSLPVAIGLLTVAGTVRSSTETGSGFSASIAKRAMTGFACSALPRDAWLPRRTTLAPTRQGWCLRGSCCSSIP